jgi:DNA-binding transcriptional ArsR family regulator
MNRSSVEPRFARIASAIGDPTRARMLCRLLDGRHYTAKELADHAEVTAATASAHLRLLVDEQLAVSRSQGRHKYFTLADGNVAHALEALMHVADGVMPETNRWRAPNMRALRHARSCYGHLAGELGVKFCTALIEKGWVKAGEIDDRSFEVTPEGINSLVSLGLPTAGATAKSKRQLYGCVDWSERKDHFAGSLAVAFLDTMIAKGWLKRDEKARSLTLTVSGKRSALATALGLDHV